MNWKKLLPVLLLVGVAVALIWQLGGGLSWRDWAAREAAFREFYAAYPATTFAIAFVAYVAATGVGLPGWTMALLYGWLFSFWPAWLLVSFAATTSATIIMLLSRYLLRDFVTARFGARLRGVQMAFERDGAFYLFTLRLIWAAPFFVVNLVMGLTTIRLVPYWLVTQLGLLPAILLFTHAGGQLMPLNDMLDQGVGGIFTPGLIIAFVLLGLFPLAVKWAWRKYLHRGKSPRLPDERDPAAPDTI